MRTGTAPICRIPKLLFTILNRHQLTAALSSSRRVADSEPLARQGGFRPQADEFHTVFAATAARDFPAHSNAEGCTTLFNFSRD
jgi:hypothetical protein